MSDIQIGKADLGINPPCADIPEIAALQAWAAQEGDYIDGDGDSMCKVCCFAVAHRPETGQTTCVAHGNGGVLASMIGNAVGEVLKDNGPYFATAFFRHLERSMMKGG